MGYRAEIKLDSISEAGIRLATFEIEFPRMILAELNTHRVFSRNSASSRAIPVAKQLEKIKNDLFIPVQFGSNQPGMQAGPPLEGDELLEAIEVWKSSANAAVEHVELLMEKNVHKQVANRILEPYMWHTVVVTSVDYDNYFRQRVSPLAQPEIQVVAGLMDTCYASSVPTKIGYGEWHTPYILPEEYEQFSLEERKQISAARCARVSYLTQDGKRDISKDLEMYLRLISADPPHWSPLEHIATPYREFNGWDATNLVAAGNFIEFVGVQKWETVGHGSSMQKFTWKPQGYAQLRHNF